MSPKTKLLLATSALTLIGLGWIFRPADPPRPAPDELPAALVRSPRASEPQAGVEVSRAAASDAGERAALLAQEAETTREPERAGDEFALRIRVLDEEDRPRAGAEVFLATRAGAWNRAGTTDARGELALRWRARCGRMPLAVAVRSGWGGAAGLRQLELSAGAEERIVFGAASGAVVRLTFVADPDQPGGVAFLSDVPLLGATFRGGRDPLATAPEVRRGEHGRIRFVEPTPRPRGEPRSDGLALSGEGQPVPQVHLGGLITSGSQGFQAVRLSGTVELAFETDPTGGAGDGPGEAGAAPSARAWGTLHGASGVPLPGVRLEARDANGAVVAATRSDERGGYELVVLPTRALTLRAGGGERGRSELAWDAEREPEHRWDPWLDRGLELLGRVVDAEQQPLGGWRVEARVESVDALWWDVTTSAEDGRFAIPNCPQGPLRLELRPAQGAAPLPAVVVERSWAGVEEATWQVPENRLPRASLAVQVADGDGRPAADVELRLWQADTGNGTWLAGGDAPGAFRLEGLPAGAYRLVAGRPGSGWREVASFRLAPGEALDLGHVTLPEPGELTLALPETPGAPADDPPVEVGLRRLDQVMERDVLEAAAPPEAPLGLPAGRYEVRWRRGTGAERRELELAAGGRARVLLDAARAAGAPAAQSERR